MRRSGRGRVGIEQERLISAEEGMLFSPLHSRAYFILGPGLEGEDILKEAKQRFIKVVYNIFTSNDYPIMSGEKRFNGKECKTEQIRGATNR